MNVELRPSFPDDRDFLARLYASTRADEIAPLGWSLAQQEAFCRMQFSAQQRWYEMAYPAAEHQIIATEQQPIGRIIVVREQNAMRLIDISLLPEYRGRGIGTDLICALARECATAGAILRLQVLKVNPAMRLYKRLGFISTACDQIYVQMELRPAPEDAQSRVLK